MMTRFIATIAAGLIGFGAGAGITNTAHAGIAPGDSFIFTIEQEGALLDQQTVAIGDTITSDALSFLELSFLDEDTFELDFFDGGGARTNLIFTLSGLDFIDGMTPSEIIGLSLVSAAFGFDVTLAFTGDSLTITFPALDGIQSADGEILVIDILTAPIASAPEIPLPAGAWLFITGVGALALRRKRAAS